MNVILISVTYFNEGPKVKLFETLSLECFIGKAFCPLLLNSETCIVDSRPPGLRANASLPWQENKRIHILDQIRDYVTANYLTIMILSTPLYSPLVR